MHKKLITQAFEKAKNERKNIGDINPSLSNIAKDISNYVDEKTGLSLGERTYRDYFNEAKKLISEDRDININQLRVLNGLYTYLGYKNYAEFVEDNPPTVIIPVPTKPEDDSPTIKTIWEDNTKTIVISFIILISSIIIIPINKTKWMVWQDGEYIEVNFDTSKYEFQQLKIYNKNRIINFKQNKAPNCNTKFFKLNGKPNLWYGKNAKGELEYFTYYGKHPETGDTLKKITKYMITTHICSEWK